MWVSFWLLPLAAALNFSLPFNASLYTSGSIEAADGLATAFWQLSGNTLSVAVAAKTSGFVGFGLNYSPVMAGADIMLAQGDGGGQIVLRDMHAGGYETPTDDLTTDFFSATAQRTNGVTWFTYSRTLTNCDTNGDLQLQDGVSYYGLLARGSSDALVYHGSTAREAIPMSLTAPVSVALPPTAVTLDVVAPPTPVPLGPGSYVCSYHQLPSSERYHIVKYKTIQGSSSSAGVLHHVNMNACDGPVPGLTLGANVPCGSAMNCNTGLLSGGYGPDGVSLPSDVGIAIGLGAVQYVIISRHFYNPGNVQGVVDVDTKFTLWYTNELRPNELGTLSLAQLNITIPAGATRHNVLALLPKDCTQALPPTGITVTAVSVHMHESGLAASVRVIRGGQELAPLAVIDPWDSSHPAINTLYQLMPGDYVRATCTYNNPYSYALHEGSSLSDEMCVFALTYYPKIEDFAGAVDFADGFTVVPAGFATYCGPQGTCTTTCGPGGACGTGGSCQTFCGGGNIAGQCAPCAQCVNCAQCLNCNITAPRVFCESNVSAGLIFDPPERYSAFTPYVSNSNCTPVSAAPTPVPDPSSHTVNWRVPAAPDRLVVAVGDKVQFAWSGTHNVVSLTAAKFGSCDFTGSNVLAAGGSAFQWTAVAAGDYYFGCSVGAHCAGGMKLWVTVQPPNVHPVNWAIPTSPSTVQIALGESVAFSWTGNHNVWQLPDQRSYETCDFTANGATELKAATSDSSFTYTPSQAGTFYIACQIPGHCSGSMKVQVIVGTSRAPTAAQNTVAPSSAQNTAAPSSAQNTGAPSPVQGRPTEISGSSLTAACTLAAMLPFLFV